MKDVDLSKLIVSYRSVERRLSAGLEAVASPGAMSLEGGDDLQKAAFVAGLEQARIEIAKATRIPTVFAVPDHGPSALLLSYFAQEAARDGKVIAAPEGNEAKFDDKDILGWMRSFFTWWRGLKKADFITASPGAEVATSNDVRIALLGDWGTNLYGAPACARAIQSAVPAYDGSCTSATPTTRAWRTSARRACSRRGRGCPSP